MLIGMRIIATSIANPGGSGMYFSGTAATGGWLIRCSASKVSIISQWGGNTKMKSFDNRETCQRHHSSAHRAGDDVLICCASKVDLLMQSRVFVKCQCA